VDAEFVPASDPRRGLVDLVLGVPAGEGADQRASARSYLALTAAESFQRPFRVARRFRIALPTMV
jgi:hypothetical protein